MAKLVVIRGLPASGKTTLAQSFVDREHNYVRVERDQVRHMLHGSYWNPEYENDVTRLIHGNIETLLKNGRNVVSSDTNLPNRTVRELKKIADRSKAEFHILDLTDVDVEECIRRDRGRHKAVGEEVIRDKYNRFVRGNPCPLPFTEPEVVNPEEELYVPDENLPEAYIFDIDGTVALNNSGRSPYDESRVMEDDLCYPVWRAIRLAQNHGTKVIFLSGRSEDCREITQKWLDKHFYTPGYSREPLFMRPSGDKRQDSIVKSELFDKYVRYNYNVLAVYDDRQQVVDMWRRRGIPCFQVAPGEF